MKSKTFTDANGRAWTVGITVWDEKQVRARLGVRLYDLIADGFKGLGELLGDPVTLVEIIHVLVEPQVKASGVTDEDFFRSFSGDVLDAAAWAFLEALADFFPSPRHRDAIRALIAKSELLGSKVMDRAMRELEAMDLDSEADRLIGSSGGSPGSPGSTPTP